MEVDFQKLINEVGMKKILEGLIDVLDREDIEDYESRLKHRLECALYQYENRYEE
jgi:hypothetical protein